MFVFRIGLFVHLFVCFTFRFQMLASLCVLSVFADCCLRVYVGLGWCLFNVVLLLACICIRFVVGVL